MNYIPSKKHRSTTRVPLHADLCVDDRRPSTRVGALLHPTSSSPLITRSLPTGLPHSSSTMAERQAAPNPASARPQRHWTSDDDVSSRPWQGLLRQIRQHAPNSSQLVGLLTLVVSGGILLAFACITFTVAALAFVFLGPILLLTSPVWVPVAALVFGATVVALSACSFGMAAVAGATWVYRYAMGRHPVGSDRVDYARSRIADTASHVKDYAREYGGYLKGRVKDAAPGA